MLLVIFYVVTRGLDQPRARTIEYFLWFIGLSGPLFSMALITYAIAKARWAWWPVIAACIISIGASTFFMWLFIISLLGV